MMGDHTSAMYSFCGAFFSELRAAGVHDAVVSPGARSTPLVVGADRAGMRLWVQLDERSAGFFALGLAKARRRPVALICTSGTAAANYLPAVVEANRAAVPLLVLTADRPPELRGWGANQTIDQVGLYGTNPRWFAELPVASEAEPAVARRAAARAVATTQTAPAGPVHLNFPLREPLHPDDGVPAAFEPLHPPITVHSDADPTDEAVSALAGIIAEHERGVIVAGAMHPGDTTVHDVLHVAGRAGWPVLAEPTSQLRVAAGDAVAVATASHLVRNAGFTAEHRPDAIVLLGAVPPTRALRTWLLESTAERTVVVGDGPEWVDETFTFTDAIRAHPGKLFTSLRRVVPDYGEREKWPRAWRDADAAAGEAIARALIESDMFEGRVVTALAGALPDDTSLYVGNSMAVRDVDLFWPSRDRPLDVYCNRGASGIDGMVSSALGVAAGTGEPVVLLLGDISLLHDLGGLAAAARMKLPLVMVVVDNDGGGIFSFLPIGDLGDSVNFHELFHTPHGTDLGAAVTGLGVRHLAVGSSTEIQQAVIAAIDSEGPTVIEVRVDTATSVAAHRAVDSAVRDALS